MGAAGRTQISPHRRWSRRPYTARIRTGCRCWGSRCRSGKTLEWGAMAQAPAMKPATMGHAQDKFSVPVAAGGTQSASSDCGDMCIHSSRPTQSCTPCLVAAHSSGGVAHMGGSELYLVCMCALHKMAYKGDME